MTSGVALEHCVEDACLAEERLLALRAQHTEQLLGLRPERLERRGVVGIEVHEG